MPATGGRLRELGAELAGTLSSIARVQHVSPRKRAQAGAAAGAELRAVLEALAAIADRNVAGASNRGGASASASADGSKRVVEV